MNQKTLSLLILLFLTKITAYSQLIFTVNGVSFTMISVEGGTFTMGATSEQGEEADNDEKPAHSVKLSNYHIGKTEVTQELWHAVMGNNPATFKGSKRPVERVSWNDCQEFIIKLNSLTGQSFRLPTEAEWKFAARGGNNSHGYKYAGSNCLNKVAWYWENSHSETHEVATKSPNELGIYDMSGNVWEWCQDWYDENYYNSDSQSNSQESSSVFNRVFRGGGANDDIDCCHIADRLDTGQDSRGDYLGLRLAL